LVKPVTGLVCLLAVTGLLVTGCAGQSSVAPVTKHAQSNSRWNPSIHKVRRGDTLFSIAFQHGQDYRTLARWNGIKAPYTIYVGQKISLRPGKSRSSNARKVAKSSTKQKNKQKITRERSSKSLKENKKIAKKPLPKPSTKGFVKGKVNWQWPSKGMIIETFSGKDATRKGIDIGGRAGQVIEASANGRVVYSGSGLRGYGRLIIIKHNERYLSAYAHNRKLLVKEGQQVKQGQKIAEMGRSGTDRVKLHFEIRREGTPVNPLRFLPKRSG